MKQDHRKNVVHGPVIVKKIFRPGQFRSFKK